MQKGKFQFSVEFCKYSVINKELINMTGINENFDIFFERDQVRVRDALKDLIMLSGVLKDLSGEIFWDDPRRVLDALRVFDLILKGTFYEEEAIQGEQELVYRFERIYELQPTIDIPRLVRLGRRYNWITDSHNPPLKFTGTGKRMVMQLLRLVNDALVYHSQPAELKEIHQAERDLQLAKSYEDIGVGSQDTIASVLNNLDNAVNDLKFQREKYIQDRRALEKYQSVLALLEMLERELGERFARLKGAIDQKYERQHRRSATLFYRVIQELSSLLGENAYVSQLEVGRKVLRVNRDRFLQYLVDAYSDSLPGTTLKPVQTMQYMEEGIYDDGGDSFAGLWMPFTLPPRLHEDDVERGVRQLEDWIYRWEPPRENSMSENIEYHPARAVTARELASLLGAATSVAAELETDTRPIIDAIAGNPGISVAKLLAQLGGGWAGALRHLLVLSYLVSEEEVKLFTYKNGKDKATADVKTDGWRLNYPDGEVRFVKGTAVLGKQKKYDLKVR